MPALLIWVKTVHLQYGSDKIICLSITLVETLQLQRLYTPQHPTNNLNRTVFSTPVAMGT
ncbi:MAG: hypothetical protein V7K54_28660 [Nostoc sp.]